MIENRLIDQVWCLDQNTDNLELIETICFNTIVLDLRSENDNCVTHIIIDRKTAQKLSESLKKWAEGENYESN